MNIRPAENADLAWLRPLAAGPAKHLWPGPVGLGLWLALFRPRPNEFFLVDEGRGFVHGKRTTTGQGPNRAVHAKVDQLFVTEPARRTGLGRALLEPLGRPVRLWTDGDNAGGLAFYRALGFVVERRETGARGERVHLWLP